MSKDVSHAKLSCWLWLGSISTSYWAMYWASYEPTAPNTLNATLGFMMPYSVWFYLYSTQKETSGRSRIRWGPDTALIYGYFRHTYRLYIDTTASVTGAQICILKPQLVKLAFWQQSRLVLEAEVGKFGQELKMLSYQLMLAPFINCTGAVHRPIPAL